MYSKGQMVKTVYGETAEIFDCYDNIYTVWINGQGMTYLHGTKILGLA